MNEVVMTAGAVLAANLLTVMFVYFMYQLHARERRGERLPFWLCWGAAAPLIFAGGAVYLGAG